MNLCEDGVWRERGARVESVYSTLKLVWMQLLRSVLSILLIKVSRCVWEVQEM